jgi:MFS family permease
VPASGVAAVGLCFGVASRRENRTMAIEATGPTFGRDAKLLGLVGVAHFSSHFYHLALPPLFPILKAEFDVGYTELGLLVTVVSVATGIAQTPVGFLVDRFGARNILIAGHLVMAGAIVLAGLSSGYPALLLLMVLFGLGDAVIHPADYAIMTAAVDKGRRGRAYGLHSFAGLLGWSAAPLTMIALAGMLGWRTALVVVGAAGLVVTLTLALGRGLLHDEMTATAGAPSRPADIAGTGRYASVLLSPAILTMFGFYVVSAAATAGINSFLVTALAALHGTPLATANAALTGYLAAGAVGVLLGGLVADRTTRHELVATVAFALGAVTFVIVGQAALPALLLIAVLAFAGLADGAIRPSRDMVVSAVTPAGASGKVFGFVSTGLGVGGAATPVLLGWTLDQGGAQWLFILIPLFLLVATAAILAARRQHPA